MRVLVTRAEADAGRTMHALAAMGHEGVPAPVLRIVPRLTSLPIGPFEAVLTTSAHAFAGGAASLDALLRLPLFAVGQTTAEAARRVGFKDVRVSLGDAAALAALVTLTLPKPARLIFLAGHDRKPTVEAALDSAGYPLTIAETYAAEAEESWPGAVHQALAGNSLAAALHFSRRSAALAVELADRHGLMSPFLALSHLCLSQDVTVPLQEAGADRILVAAEPTEAALLARLDDAGS